MLATMWPASLNAYGLCVYARRQCSKTPCWPYVCSDLIVVLNFLRFIVYLSSYVLCNLCLFTGFSQVNTSKILLSALLAMWTFTESKRVRRWEGTLCSVSTQNIIERWSSTFKILILNHLSMVKLTSTVDYLLVQIIMAKYFTMPLNTV